MSSTEVKELIKKVRITTDSKGNHVAYVHHDDGIRKVICEPLTDDMNAWFRVRAALEGRCPSVQIVFSFNLRNALLHLFCK